MKKKLVTMFLAVTLTVSMLSGCGGGEAEESAPAEEAVEEPVAQEPAAPTSAICPHCGAPAIPDANGCCEFCGGRL